MGILSCYVDERTLRILEREALARGRTVESLAEAAIENEAIASLPGGLPHSGQYFPPEPYGRESTIRSGYFEDDMP